LLKLLYGDIEGDLVFGPERLVRRLSEVYAAVYGATSWRDFRTRIEAISARYDDLTLANLKGFFQDLEADGGLDEPYDHDHIWGLAGGDWPEWLHQEMLEWMPPEISSTYGRVRASALNGNCLLLDPADEGAIVEALRARGYTCTRDDAMVRAAAGY
jgi:hypothetical protein